MFPKSDRVIYGQNPLEEVICQLRFPDILRIRTEPPAEFQDRIRQKGFPEYKEHRRTMVPGGLPAEIAKLIGPPIAVEHKFASEDGEWHITLSQGFIALSSLAYRRWEAFQERLEMALGALQELYEPSYFVRIGLRYRDVISREKLDLADVGWGDLLSPHIAAELAAEDLTGSVAGAARELRIVGEQNRQVFMRHGLRFANSAELFEIDADFSVEGRIAIDAATDHLNYFNRQAGRLFRWCIAERLHEAMDPRVPE